MATNVLIWITACLVVLSLENTMIQAQCSGTARLDADTSRSKEILSPGYPSKFSNVLRCSWKITAPFGYRVLLTFIDFDTYTYDSSILGLCYISDYVEVYDGSDSTISSKLLGKYCGSFLPASAVSTYTNIFLSFKSTTTFGSTKPSKRRFKISYTAVKKPLYLTNTECSPYSFSSKNLNIKLKSENQTKYIESPLYPNAYPSNIKCRWYITASSRYKRIYMTISESKVYSVAKGSCGSSSNENLQDLIEIRDGPSSFSTKIKTICNPLTNPLRIVSTGKSLTVYFKSNDDNYYSKTTDSTARFRMEYHEINAVTDVSECSPYKTSNENNNLQATALTTRQYIISPWYPGKYPTSIKCTWYIKASSGSKKIKLRMSNVKIYNRVPKTCNSYSFNTQDKLKITDGSSTYSDDLKTVCSPLSSATVESTGSYMTVQFETDADDYFVGSSAGFKLEYWEFDDLGVGEIVGIVIAVIVGIGIIICCGVCICRSKGSSGHVQRVPTQSTETTTAISNPPTQQYPMQAQGGAPQAPAGSYPSEKESYPPPGQSYPPPGQAYPPPSHAYQPPGQAYPPPGQAYPPPGQAYPPPDQAYPPPSQAYPPPVSYPPPVNDPIPTTPPPQYFSVVDPSQVPPAYNPQFHGASGTNPPYPTKT